MDRSQVYQALVYFDIPFPAYNQSQHMKKWYASQPPNTGIRLTRKAHAAIRGKKRPHSSLVNRALASQFNPHLSKGEQSVSEILKQYRIEHVPHFAIDKFNIDLALVKPRIAVEINGGHWHTTTTKRKLDKPKRKYLEKHGWRVIYLCGRLDEIERDASRLIESDFTQLPHYHPTELR